MGLGDIDWFTLGALFLRPRIGARGFCWFPFACVSLQLCTGILHFLSNINSLTKSSLRILESSSLMSIEAMRDSLLFSKVSLFILTTVFFHYFRDQILASRSLLLNPSFRILAATSWLPDPRFQILATNSWLLHARFQSLATRS